MKVWGKYANAHRIPFPKLNLHLTRYCLQFSFNVYQRNINECTYLLYLADEIMKFIPRPSFISLSRLRLRPIRFVSCEPLMLHTLLLWNSSVCFLTKGSHFHCWVILILPSPMQLVHSFSLSSCCIIRRLLTSLYAYEMVVCWIMCTIEIIVKFCSCSFDIHSILEAFLLLITCEYFLLYWSPLPPLPNWYMFWCVDLS